MPVTAGGDDPTPTAAQVTDALGTVVDPEFGLSVVELGLVYGIEIRRRAVTVTMTLTAPGCPLHEVMTGWVRDAAMKVPGVESVEVEVTFDPPWTPERIIRRVIRGQPRAG